MADAAEDIPQADTAAEENPENAGQVAEQPEDNAENEVNPDQTEAEQEGENTEPQTEQAETTEEAGEVTQDAAAEEEQPAETEDAGQTTTADNRNEAEVDPHAPSPEPKYDKDATATVKFLLMPSGQVATMRCGLSQTLAELKHHFASELKIPPQMILFITVRVIADTGGFRDVVVEIERATRKKPYLGGYRHKQTGLEFHHAGAQTMQKQRPPANVDRFCRDTQTVEQKHMVQQTTNDCSTQMTKIGVYVSNMKDKLVVPGKYTTADAYHANILNQVVVIQKYYRRWLAKNYVDKVRNDQSKRIEWEREEELRKKKEKEDRIKREFERRMNPKNKEDFDLLYHALEKWRFEEKDRIDRELSGAERKAALCQLLDQETQLIASIGRHKLDADEENRQKRIQGFLDKAASPKKWKGPDGKATEMDTPYTIRAQELREIYNSINMKYLTQDERLDVLLTLKHTVKEHDCKLTQEIIELIDREADLLMRGVKESNLDGLRKRISTLFLQYIKTPMFNPEAARLLKVPQDPSQLRKNIYFCPSCNQYLPSTEFHLSSNSRTVGKCRKCDKIDNDGRIRQDYSHYKFMLKSLRNSEQDYGDDAKIAFLMQENDLRYLVENVWNSQSILSAWEDLYDLALVRWDKHEEWAPWNCILLTKEEATAHEKLEGLEEAYGKTFIHKVKHKHTLARNYFSRLPGMAEHLRSSDQEKTTKRGPSVAGRAVPVASAKA